jgi:hemoglobin
MRLNLSADPTKTSHLPGEHCMRHFPSLAIGLSLMWMTGCASSPPQPLYVAMGGQAVIEQVVTRTMTRVSQDPRTARTFKGIKMPFLIDSVSKHICQVADGPCVYEGETMARAHADLGLVGSDFELMVQTMREELDRAGVSQSAKNELLRRLAPTRRDIVTR